MSLYVCSLFPEIILKLKVSAKGELALQNPKSSSFLSEHFAWLFVYFVLFLSKAINPIICLTFVESYRRGMRELLICHKNPSLKGREKIKCKIGHVEQMTLQRIRIFPDNKSNLSARQKFQGDKHRINVFKQFNRAKITLKQEIQEEM